MNDITALMASMKAAAEKAGKEQWQTRKGFSGVEVIVKGSMVKGRGCVSFQPVATDFADGKTAKTVALFNPANVLALVEALEKAQKSEKQWREVVDASCTDDADWHKLTNSNNELISLLSQALCKQVDRIAELESRIVTVKLPEVRITIAESKLRNLTYQQLDAYNAGATRAAVKLSQVLAAAGIQVIEGEGQHGGNCE